MDSDSINNISSSASNCKDLSRKKRRSAKLKQCKLDARREQWLSQSAVKNKGCCKEGTNGGDSKQTRPGERDRSLENLEMRRIDEANGGGENGSVQHESDSESSPSNSPTSIGLLGGTGSGISFTNSSSSSCSSSSTSSGGCCSGSITEEEGDNGCLDDWEAVADALAADDDKQETERNENNRENPCVGSTPGHEPSPQLGSNGAGSDLRNAKPECPRMVQRATGNSRAWKADDAFRPQTLPNLSKQRSFPATDRHFGQGGVSWARSSAFPVPSSCPICYEDLDFTDSSFLPCLCGFRLCLFCHKRILEEDGRCPGCRKPYEHDPLETEATVQGGSLTFRLARSCSMIARS
ncbi:suppressor protein SRP40-like [Durio zibethinus]|uniref:Suppressor protein SRP40-like n=1 Tax=Durio zibethinus TaxID=66656 RepID=A0A6P5XG98_DURZI|nr:suppressor protein SRP40-like [Durio zibethinus]XP_022727371.1 suppressor protein SRP40-like [Durio zibethinus]